MKKMLIVVLITAAGAGGWFAARHFGRESKRFDSGQRKILYYQSPMHPWITSDKPGRCTICGMQLEPVYEGQRGFGGGEGLVMLGSNPVQVINVQTAVVSNEPLTRALRVAGVINENDAQHRRLSAYAEGRIEKLFVNYVGAEVTKGQPLAIFYSPSLLAAESDYLTVLNQQWPAGTSEALQQDRARLLDAAAQRLKRLGYSDAQLATIVEKQSADARTEILAPLTGTVVARNVYEGQYVKEGEALFEIADFSTMWFQFDAYERDLAFLRIGQEVEVTLAALPGKTFTASISFIDPNLNDMTRSAKVRVELPNPLVDDAGQKRRLLYRQLFAEGVVKCQSPSVLALPRTAVLFASKPIVYVQVGEGAYEQRLVKLGRRGDDDVEVLEGVRAGERVVTTGNLLIDAQAQLDASTRQLSDNRDATPMTKADSEPGGVSLATLSAAQNEAAREFLKLASDASAALASDNVGQFNDIAPRVHAMIPKLFDALGPVKALRPALLKLEESGHLEKAKDLPGARKAFLPFSMASVDLARQLRAVESFKSTKIFNCPMANRAIPGAAKNGQWIQLEGPLRNPFFGSEMLDCGNEVK